MKVKATTQIEFSKEFTIYKKGVTELPVTVLSKVGEPFDREEKIQKYLDLGYTVCNNDGTQITR